MSINLLLRGYPIGTALVISIMSSTYLPFVVLSVVANSVDVMITNKARKPACKPKLIKINEMQYVNA